MEISRVTSKGQITIPVEIRKKLNLKTGDKVVFIEDGDRIIFANSSMVALRNFQQIMKGEAETAGNTGDPRNTSRRSIVDTAFRGVQRRV